MELAFLIYLIDVFCYKEGNPSGFALLGIILVIVWTVCSVIGAVTNSEEFRRMLSAVLPLKIIAVVFCIIGLLVPSKEAAYTMLAAYGLQQVATNERVQEIGGKSLDLLESYIDKYAKEVGSNED